MGADAPMLRREATSRAQCKARSKCGCYWCDRAFAQRGFRYRAAERRQAARWIEDDR